LDDRAVLRRQPNDRGVSVHRIPVPTRQFSSESRPAHRSPASASKPRDGTGVGQLNGETDQQSRRGDSKMARLNRRRSFSNGAGMNALEFARGESPPLPIWAYSLSIRPARIWDNAKGGRRRSRWSESPSRGSRQARTRPFSSRKHSITTVARRWDLNRGCRSSANRHNQTAPVDERPAPARWLTRGISSARSGEGKWFRR